MVHILGHWKRLEKFHIFAKIHQFIFQAFLLFPQSPAPAFSIFPHSFFPVQTPQNKNFEHSVISGAPNRRHGTDLSSDPSHGSYGYSRAIGFRFLSLAHGIVQKRRHRCLRSNADHRRHGAVTSGFFAIFRTFSSPILLFSLSCKFTRGRIT